MQDSGVTTKDRQNAGCCSNWRSQRSPKSWSFHPPARWESSASTQQKVGRPVAIRDTGAAGTFELEQSGADSRHWAAGVRAMGGAEAGWGFEAVGRRPNCSTVAGRHVGYHSTTAPQYLEASTCRRTKTLHNAHRGLALLSLAFGWPARSLVEPLIVQRPERVWAVIQR